MSIKIIYNGNIHKLPQKVENYGQFLMAIRQLYKNDFDVFYWSFAD